MKKEMDDQYFSDKNEASSKQNAVSKFLMSDEGKAYEATTSFIGSTMGKLADMQDTNTKKGFERSKKLKMAEALMSIPSAAMSAYEATVGIPIVGPALAPIAAGAAVMFGMAQVAQINSQTFQPRMAGGNVFKGKEYVVGERGKELFVPNANGKILNDSQMDSVTGEVKNTTVNESKNINFNITATDGQDVARMLTDQKDLIVNIVRRGL